MPQRTCMPKEKEKSFFLKRKLRKKLVKAGDSSEDSLKMNKIASNIRFFLKNETSFETNQEVLG